jgi:DNA (cytosine-5)-methyltransferase 1
LILVTEGGVCRSRLMTAREAARLMGLPDSYRLPASVTAGLLVTGDGVAAPLVRWLAAQVLEPVLAPLWKRPTAA